MRAFLDDCDDCVRCVRNRREKRNVNVTSQAAACRGRGRGRGSSRGHGEQQLPAAFNVLQQRDNFCDFDALCDQPGALIFRCCTCSVAQREREKERGRERERDREWEQESCPLQRNRNLPAMRMLTACGTLQQLTPKGCQRNSREKTNKLLEVLKKPLSTVKQQILVENRINLNNIPRISPAKLSHSYHPRVSKIFANSRVVSTLTRCVEYLCIYSYIL